MTRKEVLLQAKIRETRKTLQREFLSPEPNYAQILKLHRNLRIMRAGMMGRPDLNLIAWMILFLGAIAISGALLSLCAMPASAASEQVWRPIARECAKEIGEQGGLWPKWAQCAVDRYYSNHPIPARLKPTSSNTSAGDLLRVVTQVCINQEQQARAYNHTANNLGDPVKDVFACIGD